jgi:Fe2+ or Zn2+ uptake regulation protein
MTALKLTPKQSFVLKFLYETLQERGQCPLIEEITKHSKTSSSPMSKSSVISVLKILNKKNLVMYPLPETPESCAKLTKEGLEYILTQRKTEPMQLNLEK